jgi:hypothetical protein
MKIAGVEVNPVSGPENIEKQLSDNTNTVSQGVMGTRSCNFIPEQNQEIFRRRHIYILDPKPIKR